MLRDSQGKRERDRLTRIGTKEDHVERWNRVTPN